MQMSKWEIGAQTRDNVTHLKGMPSAQDDQGLAAICAKMNKRE